MVTDRMSAMVTRRRASKLMAMRDVRAVAICVSSRNFDAINSVLNFDVDEFVDFWFRTSAGKIVIGQKPNTPMVVYSTAKTVASIAPKGRLRDGARLVADASLTYWAVLELTDGVNRFRKLMGFATLFGMLSSKLVKR